MNAELSATEIKTSTLPHAGRGVFTTAKLRSNAAIGEYTGMRISTRAALAKKNDNAYMFGIRDQADNRIKWVIDAADEYGSYVKYVNTNLDPDRINILAVTQNDRLYYVTKREIEAGEELFVSYGQSYDDKIRKFLTEKGVDVHNPDHWPAVQRLLNDPDWRYLKTAEVII